MNHPLICLSIRCGLGCWQKPPPHPAKPLAVPGRCLCPTVPSHGVCPSACVHSCTLSTRSLPAPPMGLLGVAEPELRSLASQGCPFLRPSMAIRSQDRYQEMMQLDVGQ